MDTKNPSLKFVTTAKGTFSSPVPRISIPTFGIPSMESVWELMMAMEALFGV